VLLFLLNVLHIWDIPIKFLKKDVSGQWWAALSIMTAFFITVLLISFYKQKEVDELKQNLEKLNKKTNQLQALSQVPALFLEVRDENMFSNEERWQETFEKVKELYDLGYYDSLSLRRFSTIAWKEGYPEICFDLRKLAYELDKKDPWNKTYLANVFQFVENRVKTPGYFKNERNFLNFLDIDHSQGNAYAMSEAIKGRYYSKRNKNDKALVHYIDATSENTTFWHFRSHIMCLISMGNKRELAARLELWETDSSSIWNERNDIRATGFKKFAHAFIDTSNNTPNSNNVAEFYEFFTPLNIGKISSIKSYDKAAAFNVLNNLTDDRIYPLDTFPERDKLIDFYLTYYYFFSENDAEADQALTEAKIKDIFKKINLTWSR
jgi:hypothetical protein